MQTPINPANHRHLTGDELAELLACGRLSPNDPAQAHLAACPDCTAEFASLRDSLALFKEASVAFAQSRSAQMPRLAPPTVPARRAVSPALLWVLASAVLIAAILPLQMRRETTAHPPAAAASAAAPHTTESDEALLDDINRDLSASVPTPMKALADPTAAATETPLQRTN